MMDIDSIIKSVFPKMLTPSQQAGHEMMSGAHEAGQVITAPKKGFSNRGALLGLNQGLQAQPMDSDMPAPQPMQTWDAIQMPHYQYGGQYDDQQPFVVGEDGEEVVDPRARTVTPMKGFFADGQSTTPEPTVAPTPGRDSMLGGATGAATAVNPREQQIAQARQDVMSAQQVSHAPWKGFGYGMLQGLNNALNGTHNPIESWDDKKRRQKSAEPLRRLGMLEEGEKFDTNIAHQKALDENLRTDNERQAQQVKDLADYRAATIDERKALRESRDAHTKMRVVQSMWSKLPAYDPKDPRYAEITKALGDVQLPLTPKDAKKQVKLIQDADSGAWTMTLTDPYNGQQEVRPVVKKDGKTLVTTSTAKVAADAATGRQEAGFKHDDKKQEALTTYRNAVLGLRQQALNLAGQKDERGAQDAKRKEDTLKARLKERVKAGLLDQSDYDEIFGDVSIGEGEAGAGIK